MPTHYGFKLDHISRDLAKFKEQLLQPREKLLQKRSAPSSEKSWASQAKSVASKVNSALKSQTPEGIWMEGDEIDASLITKQLMALCRYLEGARRGGEAFAKLRQ